MSPFPERLEDLESVVDDGRDRVPLEVEGLKDWQLADRKDVIKIADLKKLN